MIYGKSSTSWKTIARNSMVYEKNPISWNHIAGNSMVYEKLLIPWNFAGNRSMIHEKTPHTMEYRRKSFHDIWKNPRIMERQMELQ